MEVPGLGVQLELQLPAYTAATATPDPSRVCDLHQILNPLSEVRDQTTTSWFLVGFISSEPWQECQKGEGENNLKKQKTKNMKTKSVHWN